MTNLINIFLYPDSHFEPHTLSPIAALRDAVYSFEAGAERELFSLVDSRFVDKSGCFKTMISSFENSTSPLVISSFVGSATFITQILESRYPLEQSMSLLFLFSLDEWEPETRQK